MHPGFSTQENAVCMRSDGLPQQLELPGFRIFNPDLYVRTGRILVSPAGDTELVACDRLCFLAATLRDPHGIWDEHADDFFEQRSDECYGLETIDVWHNGCQGELILAARDCAEAFTRLCAGMDFLEGEVLDATLPHGFSRFGDLLIGRMGDLAMLTCLEISQASNE